MPKPPQPSWITGDLFLKIIPTGLLNFYDWILKKVLIVCSVVLGPQFNFEAGKWAASEKHTVINAWEYLWQAVVRLVKIILFARIFVRLFWSETFLYQRLGGGWSKCRAGFAIYVSRFLLNGLVHSSHSDRNLGVSNYGKRTLGIMTLTKFNCIEQPRCDLQIQRMCCASHGFWRRWG